MCIKQLCCLKWMILDLLLSCQANACNGRDGVDGGQERHGCASAAGCRIQLHLHNSCAAYTDDFAAFLELEDWRPLHASVDGLIDAWHKGGCHSGMGGICVDSWN